MKENKMKRALQRGDLVLGSINRYFRSPEIAQVFATAGYDFIWTDMEHSCFDLETVADNIRAALAADITPLVRVPELQSHFISRVLDSGAMGVIVPQIEEKEEAEAMIQYSKYHPQGRRRTVSRIVHGDYAPVNRIEFDRKSNEEIMSIALVESGKGVENIEKITSVKGLDAVIVGVGDLSLSLGLSGQTDHEVRRQRPASWYECRSACRTRTSAQKRPRRGESDRGQRRACC